MLAAQSLNLAALPIDLALLPFEFGDQFFARRGAPLRSHASVMPRFNRQYKRKLRRSRRLDGGSSGITR